MRCVLKYERGVFAFSALFLFVIIALANLPTATSDAALPIFFIVPVLLFAPTFKALLFSLLKQF